MNKLHKLVAEFYKNLVPITTTLADERPSEIPRASQGSATGLGSVDSVAFASTAETSSACDVVGNTH